MKFFFDDFQRKLLENLKFFLEKYKKFWKKSSCPDISKEKNGHPIHIQFLFEALMKKTKVDCIIT